MERHSSVSNACKGTGRADLDYLLDFILKFSILWFHIKISACKGTWMADLDNITGSEVALIPVVLRSKNPPPEQVLRRTRPTHIYLHILQARQSG